MKINLMGFKIYGCRDPLFGIDLWFGNDLVLQNISML